MLEKEKYFNLHLVTASVFLFFFLTANSYANLQEKLFNKLKNTKTISFDFIQKIAKNEEIGNCLIKYPLLMKCDYEDIKKKSIISNGKTVAVIKKKYKKIYYYPLKSTPLYIILKKDNILNLIKNNKPTYVDSNLIEFEIIEKNSNKVKIFFDSNTLELKGWQTQDAYSNNVSFKIINLEINPIIEDSFFKIPKEKDL